MRMRPAAQHAPAAKKTKVDPEPELCSSSDAEAQKVDMDAEEEAEPGLPQHAWIEQVDSAKVTSENVPVDAEAMQRRQLPNVQLDERNDWWGGATYPGTDRPATLVHATWHTPRLVRLTKQSHSGESARDASSDAA